MSDTLAELSSRLASLEDAMQAQGERGAEGQAALESMLTSLEDAFSAQGNEGPVGKIGPEGKYQPPFAHIMTHTWALAGPVEAINYPGFYVELLSGEGAKLIGLRARLLKGSAVFEIKKNGIPLGVAEKLAVGSAEELVFPFEYGPLAVGDLISMQVTGVTGAEGLSLSLFEEQEIK
jgi:hypothetical protein